MKTFEIDIARLANAVHRFDLLADDAFFAAFEPSVVEHGRVAVRLEIDKTSALLTVRFHLRGTVELLCDRTLEPFDYPLAADHRVVFQYGDQAEELDTDLYLIPRDDQTLDLSQHVYDFIGLALPMKRLHPRFDAPADTDQPTLVYRSAADENDNQTPDPRWQALRALQNGSHTHPKNS